MSTRRWPKRFLYSAATRAGAVFIQACHLQERGGCWLDRLAPIAALCAAMGWIITYVSSACNTNVSLFLLGVFIGVKKPPQWAVGGVAGCAALHGAFGKGFAGGGVFNTHLPVGQAAPLQ